MAIQLLANLSTASLFIQEWLQRPQQMGAVLPSSRNLAGAMADWLPADPDDYVLELGPGTGAVTQAMLERGLRHDRLVTIEKSPKLSRLLRDRFPRIRVITGDALQLDRLFKKHLRRVENVGAVISSLPLRNFVPDDAMAIADKIRSLLKPDGTWVQYSYHLGTRRHQGTTSFRLLSSEVVWWNLPPARVSVYQRPDDGI